MLGIFKKQTGTRVKVVVEYVVDYDEKINKGNVNAIVDFKDLIRDSSNIVAIRDLEFKTIRN